MRRVTLEQLAHLLDIPCCENVFVHGAVIDSRQTHSDALFVALKGEHVDGHSFLKHAASKGAAAALIDETYSEECPLPALRVPKVLPALQKLAKQFRKEFPLVCGITGSCGKTTTKHFLDQMTKAHVRSFATIKSYNSQATLPLALFMADGNEELLILEMGMSLPGEMERLVDFAAPDLSVITTIAPQHASNFQDGLWGVAKAKGEIYKHPRTKRALLPLDAPFAKELEKMGSALKIGFSFVERKADFFLESEEKSVKIYEQGVLKWEGPFYLPHDPFIGDLLPAYAAARLIGLSPEKIGASIDSLTLPSMRFEVLEKGGIVIVNDAYNALPSSTMAALRNLPEPKRNGKRVAVLGEMPELGEESRKGHLDVAKCALNAVDVLVCMGEKTKAMCDYWKSQNREAYHFSKMPLLKQKLLSTVQEGDVLLLKGARSACFESLIELWESNAAATS